MKNDGGNNSPCQLFDVLKTVNTLDGLLRDPHPISSTLEL